MKDVIKQLFLDSIETKKGVMDLIPQIESSANILIDAIKKGNKVLVCGNGGSAADAQHFVAELVVRFETDRPAIPAVALAANSSNLTACANDFGYDDVFKRQLEAFGRPGDVLVGISTSGSSVNVVSAFEVAKSLGLKTIGLTGQGGTKMGSLFLDECVMVPSVNTARVQESHITIIHVWCKLIDQALK